MSDQTVYKEPVDIISASTQFEEVATAQKTRLIELKSTYGLSNLRDVQTTAGSGSVSNANGIYTLDTTANGTDRAVLDSAERGRYVPGATAEVGIGILSASTPSGNQVMRWGYFDDNDGFGFGQDATGFFVFVRRSGTDTVTRQSDFNVDEYKGHELDEGAIYQIQFTWYGYGKIEFQIVQEEDDGTPQIVRTLHRHRTTGETSVVDPNLPIRAEIDNDGEASAASLDVGGRQYAILGTYNPNRRVNAELREGTSVSSTIVPLVTLRRKSAFETVSVKVAGLDIITDSALLVEIRTGTSGLTSASFGTPTNTTASETAVEADISATAVTGGEILWKGLFAGGTGNQQSIESANVPDFDFIGTDNVSIVARKLSGETDATVECIFRVREEW